MKIHGVRGVWAAKDRNAEIDAIWAGKRPCMVELHCAEPRSGRPPCWWPLGGVFDNPRLGAVLVVLVPRKPEPDDEPTTKRIQSVWAMLFELQGPGGMALAGYCPRHGTLPLDEKALGDAVDRWRVSALPRRPQSLTLKSDRMR